MLLGATMKDSIFEGGRFNAIQRLAPAGAELAATDGIARTVDIPIGTGAIGRAEKGPYLRVGKRIADILFVLIMLPILVPITLICALVLWVEGGQPFYCQNRLGEGGRLFCIFKLRTMCRDADAVLESCLATDPALRAEWDRTQKLKADPRITRVGEVLRKTSLDELPQFWNVLKGEMSVVGPRPMMPEQLPMYPDPAPYFALRPGITGLWQVSDRNANSFAHRATVDTDYHDRLSFLLDLRILIQTVGVVIRRTGY